MPLKNLIPAPARTRYQLARLRYRNKIYDRNRLRFRPGARPSPTVEAFRRIGHIPGYFTYEDATHFELILRTQSATGVSGDVLEIGAFFGRSAAVLVGLLAEGERLVLIDPFETEVAYNYETPPSRAAVERHIRDANPNYRPEQVEFVEQYSTAVTFPADRKFRFIHIDGSHEHADVLADLELAAGHVVEGGVIAMDDFEHPDWPGVTSAANQFFPREGFVRIGDFSRQSEAGRKLYYLRGHGQ